MLLLYVYYRYDVGTIGGRALFWRQTRCHSDLRVCCVFTRYLPGGGRRRRHGASDGQLFPVRRSADPYCQQSARARAFASRPREPTFHRSPSPQVPCDPSTGPDRFDRWGSPPSGSLSLGRRRGAFTGSRSLTVNPGQCSLFPSRPLIEKPPHAHVRYLF